jgi:CRISPR/Cas system-associated endoribonuclease Cas2
MQPQPWLLTYDIRDKKRLARMHRLACSVGLPINYSAFYIEASVTVLTQLRQQIVKVMDIQVDSARLYPCCRLNRITFLGRPILPAGGWLFKAGQHDLCSPKDPYASGYDPDHVEQIEESEDMWDGRLVNGLWLG